ncbi:FtsB family cell division protein [Anaerobacillus isosaccharinicus]|uniref:FtsB family cell division protein n=1 Tax=Anaerobacillus isosaccharinicus TaxID=1532552 RepID=A0A7S7RCW9_9BACI|nr:septum formation initiator family protein [Anaerobacillus isosaccharinicus]MBA5584117.1 septum formation initiator family protein [Anaerobacillus isosaccharinicus]QOY37474.1 septum formation initiator family protein [Anaerobacillus isosaccharinicus]
MKSAQQRKVRELNSHYIEQHETQMEQKSKSKKGLVRRLSALGVFVVFVIALTVITLHSQKTVLGEKIEKKQLLDQELAKLELVERDLRDEIENLNNLNYISEIARRDYYLSKPGEIIFKVTQSSSD